MIWGVVNRSLSVLLPFLTRTVLIKFLGAQYLGLGSLFSSILMVLSLTELGFGSAIVFSMYKPIVQNDTKTICALMNTYKKIYHIVGAIILVAGLITAPFIPYLIKSDYPANLNIYVVYLIYLGNTVLSYFLFAYKNAVFSAYQREDYISKFESISVAFLNILQVVMVVVFHNFYTYVLIIPLATLIRNVLIARTAKRKFPNIVCVGQISEEMKKSIKKRITGLLSFKIYGVVFTSVDTIVISAFIGLTPLAIYNNYYYIQTSLIGFLSILTLSITAGIGHKMVTHSVEDNYRDMKNLVFVNAWLSSWCSVCLLCLYQHFIRWWVGDKLMLPLSSMVLMVVYFFFPRVSTITFTYREAAGLWWEDRLRPLIATAANLVINLILVNIIGLNGVLISTIVCSLAINIPWGSHILFRNYFKKSPKEYFLLLAFYTVITAVVGGLTLLACSLLPGEGLLALLGKAAICLVVPNGLFWLIYRRRDEFQYAKGLVARMLKRGAIQL